MQTQTAGSATQLGGSGFEPAWEADDDDDNDRKDAVYTSASAPIGAVSQRGGSPPPKSKLKTETSVEGKTQEQVTDDRETPVEQVNGSKNDVKPRATETWLRPESSAEPDGDTPSRVTPRVTANTSTSSASSTTLSFYHPLGADAPDDLTERPLLLYIPGFDGDGDSAKAQFKDLSAIYRVRAMRITPEDRTDFNGLRSAVVRYVTAWRGMPRDLSTLPQSHSAVLFSLVTVQYKRSEGMTLAVGLRGNRKQGILLDC